MKFEPPPPADEGPGTLTVHLDGASGLKAVDFGGKSDPYAILSIGEQRHTHRRLMVGAWASCLAPSRELMPSLASLVSGLTLFPGTSAAPSERRSSRSESRASSSRGRSTSCARRWRGPTP